MSRRSRLAKKLKDQEEKNVSNWKRQKYQKMAKNGELGNKDIQKYWALLNDLSNSICPNEELSLLYRIDTPTRFYYNQVKDLARSYLFND